MSLSIAQKILLSEQVTLRRYSCKESFDTLSHHYQGSSGFNTVNIDIDSVNGPTAYSTGMYFMIHSL